MLSGPLKIRKVAYKLAYKNVIAAVYDRLIMMGPSQQLVYRTCEDSFMHQAE